MSVSWSWVSVLWFPVLLTTSYPIFFKPLFCVDLDMFCQLVPLYLSLSFNHCWFVCVFFSGLFSFHHSVVFLDSPLPAFQLPAFLSPALLLAFWILDLGFVIKTDFFVILPACLCAVLLGLSFTNWVWRIFNKLNIHPCNMVMSL